MANTAYLKAIISVVDRLSPQLQHITMLSKITRKSIGDISQATRGLADSLGKPLAIGGGVAGISGLVAGSKGIIGVNSEFEDFQATLETLMGSAQKAKDSMGWVAKMADNTPFEVEDLTSAFVQLSTLGVDPTKGALKALGDMASFAKQPGQTLSASMLEATRAMASGMRGSGEMLDQFGIQAKVVGDNLVMHWNKVVNGVKMPFSGKANKDNPIAIGKGIQYIWNDIAGGNMEKQAKQWTGIMSNISGSFSHFSRMVGEAGFFEYAKQNANDFYMTLKGMEESGVMKQLAGKVSTLLIGVIKRLKTTIKDFDPNAFLKGIDDWGERLKWLVHQVGGVRNIFIGLFALFAAGPIANILSIGAAFSTLAVNIGKAGMAFSGLLLANPIFAATALSIGLVAWAGWKIWKDWAKIKTGLLSDWEQIRSGSSVWDVARHRVESFGLSTSVAMGIASVAVVGAVGKIALAFRGLLVANPVLTGVAVAVAGLGWAGYELWQNWDKIKAGLLLDWEQIRSGSSVWDVARQTVERFGLSTSVAMGIASVAVVGAVGKVALAFRGLLVANPILTGVAVAVAGLGWAGYELWQNWDKIKVGLLSGWEQIRSGSSVWDVARQTVESFGLSTSVAMGIASVAVVGALGKVALAFRGLLVANPVLTAVVVAVGALAYAGYQLWKNWDTIKAGLLKTWEDTKDAAEAIWTALGDGFTELWNAPRRSAEEFFTWLDGKMESLHGLAERVGGFFGAAGGVPEAAQNLAGRAALLPPDIAPLADKYAARYEIPPELLRRVIWQESHGNPAAVSPKGAMGLMQLMPDTARRFGVRDAFDPAQNIAGGTAYLAYLLERYNGEQAKALAAYNAGEGAVDKYHGVPPYGETQNYVTQILGPDRRNLVEGDIRVRFDNAPRGMRVEVQRQNGPLTITPEVGYRGFATGMP